MDEIERTRLKLRGVRLASLGLGMALVLMLGMRLLGLTAMPYGRWGMALAATAAVQAIMFLLVWRGPASGEKGIPGDPHFLYTPLLGAMVLLALYMLVAPELRFITLLGWFVALLFMAGLGGFHAAVILSGTMTLSYFGVAVLLHRSDYPLSLSFEAAVATAVFVTSMYAGVVFERLRGERREMRELRQRLASMALTDPLTQLPNRRHFEEVLEAELDRVRRYGGDCTVALVDVDFFKHYNDTVGHLAGDVALKELAEVMRRELRLHDMVARFGGEEFALIMINASKQEARPIVERIRVAVQEHPFRQRDAQPLGRITISAGLAAVPEDGVTFDDLLTKADDALYRAKREGRNRVRLADDSAMTDTA